MSRELDEQVARAMEWTLKETGFPVNFWLGPDGLATGYCDRPWPEDAERYGDVPMLFSGEGMWSPSTDIAAAWQVVEWMCERGYWCEMRTPFGTGDHNDGYWCGFTPHLTSGWNGVPDDWTSAPTLPEAICLSFLAAMEAHNE